MLHNYDDLYERAVSQRDLFVPMNALFNHLESLINMMANNISVDDRKLATETQSQAVRVFMVFNSPPSGEYNLKFDANGVFQAQQTSHKYYMKTSQAIFMHTMLLLLSF